MSRRLLIHGNWRDLLACCRGFETLSSLGREGEEGQETGDGRAEIEEPRVSFMQLEHTRVGPHSSLLKTLKYNQP